MDSKTARRQLDIIIKKARVHLYKPIQIAEILYRDRVEGDVDLKNIETYRTQSRKWRDGVSHRLVGRISTSSARYQDNLFEANAVPPSAVAMLGKANRTGNGTVEAYIYAALKDRLAQMEKGLRYVLHADRNTFVMRELIDGFANRPGLKRSIDKVFEILVYAFFSTLLEELDVQISVGFGNVNATILREFSDFTQKVLGLPDGMFNRQQQAKVYRVGTTNAADTGLDMWANFGVAVQIKYMSLKPSKTKEISGNISADRIVIVCKESEKDILVSVLEQFGSKGRIQSVITELELETWYEKAMRGKSSHLIGDKVLLKLASEMKVEFPVITSEFANFCKERGYDI